MFQKSFKYFVLCFVLIFNQANAEFYNADGSFKPELKRLFEIFKPLLEPHRDLKEAYERIPDDLETLNAIGQKIFLRPAGLERNQLDEHNKKFTPFYTEEFVTLIDSLECLTAKYPSRTKYAHILVHGASVQNMQQRIDFLLEILKTLDTKETDIVFLTGDRDIWESEKEWITTRFGEQEQMPTNETEIIAFLWGKSKTKEHSGLNISFVHSEKQEILDPTTGKTKTRRPNTKDTVIKWLSGNPKPGSCLSVSVQPFVYYQELTMQAALHEKGLITHYTIEGVGGSPITEENKTELTKSHMATLLDNIARTLYTLVGISKIKQKAAA